MNSALQMINSVFMIGPNQNNYIVDFGATMMKGPPKLRAHKPYNNFMLRPVASTAGPGDVQPTLTRGQGRRRLGGGAAKFMQTGVAELKATHGDAYEPTADDMDQ